MMRLATTHHVMELLEEISVVYCRCSWYEPYDRSGDFKRAEALFLVHLDKIWRSI